MNKARLEAIIAASAGDNVELVEMAADALRLPPWDAKIGVLSGGENAASHCAVCCYRNPTCFLLDRNRLTTWMRNRSIG